MDEINTKNKALFVSDKNIYNLQKKIERIVCAIYLVTDLFPNNDEIKKSLRSKSLDVLEKAYSINISREESLINEFRAILNNLRNIQSLYTISYNSNYISEMNYNVVNTQLNQIISDVNRMQFNVTNQFGFSIDESYFNVLPNNLSRNEENNPEQITDFQKDNIYRTNLKDIKRTSKGQDNVLYKNEMSFTNPESKYNKANKSERREKILKIIKDKNNVSIKDITTEFDSVSSKTIQRELNSMIKDGVIKKKGDRRWSIYFI